MSKNPVLFFWSVWATVAFKPYPVHFIIAEAGLAVQVYKDSTSLEARAIHHQLLASYTAYRHRIVCKQGFLSLPLSIVICRSQKLYQVK